MKKSVVKMAFERSVYGRLTVSNELWKKGQFVSLGGAWE